ncbi:hypothetical protein [Thermococcus sp.]
MELKVENFETSLPLALSGLLLLGAMITVLGIPAGGAVKLGWILYDIGIAGVLFVFLQEAFEVENPQNMRIAMLIAAAIVAVWGFKL